MTQSSAEKLYEACYMRVFSYVMTLTGDRGEAEEITQETMFRAISKQNSFRGESDEVTWLCAIAKNCFLDEKKHQSRHTAFPEEMAENEIGTLPFVSIWHCMLWRSPTARSLNSASSGN